jgi:hypothetical protein
VFRIQNASMSVIEERGGRPFISGVNDVGHLEVGSLGGLEIA